MFTTKKAHQQPGFTIIEVMIVLAIAGLILLIVFLAIPSLQRSSRNTEKTHDVALITSSLHDYISGHNGLLPKECNGSPGPNCDTIFLQAQHFSYYDLNNIGFKPRPESLADTFPDYTEGPNPPKSGISVKDSQNWALTMNYYVCSDDGLTAVHAGANKRDVVVLYDLEAGGGNVVHHCAQV